MSELDQAWAEAVAEAERRARGAGRTDVADYLRLRASNDFIRKTGIEWLFNTFTVHAGQANRAGGSIQIAHQEAHRFPVGSATMVGRLLTLSFGVRALSIEAGWPRAPRDGFIRGGGLACGHIKHRGLRSANEDLILVQSVSGSPEWMMISQKDKGRRRLSENAIRSHVTKLLSDNYK